MHTALILLALAAQTGDYRSGAADPNAAAVDGAAPPAEAAADPSATSPSAPAADEPATPSQIVIAPQTPQPTLVVAPGEPAVAGERAAASPLATAPPAATDANAAAPPESSVLVGGPKPAELMRTLLEPLPGDQLPGVPASLGDAMRGAATRPAQTERAQAYWALTAAAAHYYLALHESRELATLRQGVSAPSAAWDSAGKEFEGRVAAARELAAAAQMRLHRLMGAAPGSPLPLPADAPHCGRYNTRYSEIFIGRDDAIARQLNDLLPLLHADLTAAARQVDEAYDWVSYVAEHREPANDGTGMLRAYELMSERRQGFIDAVRQYNDHIAAYAEHAAPNQVEPSRLVSMLIRTSTDTSQGALGSAVQPAGAFEDADAPSASDGAATPGRRDRDRTFAQRLNFEDLRPFSRLRNRERSIVVRRGLLGRGGRDQ